MKDKSSWQRIKSIAPFVLTALVSVVLSLIIQSLFFVEISLLPGMPASPTPLVWHTPPTSQSVIPLDTPVGAVADSTSLPRSTARPSPTPLSTRKTLVMPTPPLARIAPTVSPSASSLPVVTDQLDSLLKTITEEIQMQQDIRHLESEVQRLWSAYYLARAATQIADAEDALRVNDLDEVENVLMTVGVSLDFAYERTGEQHKGPISEFRMQVGKMHEDVYIRPENMDVRLRRLRQSMLSLVDETQ